MVGCCGSVQNQDALIVVMYFVPSRRELKSCVEWTCSP
jgi:hypothetical protein